MAAVPLVEQAGVPFVSLAGAVVIVEPVKKWVFKTPHTDRMACDKIFVDMKARGVTKAALISGSGGFGKSMRAECLKVAPNHGIEIVADETYGATDTDMTAQLTKIRGSSAQAVLKAGFGQGPAIVTRKYRQLGSRCRVPVAQRRLARNTSSSPATPPKGVRLPAAALLVLDLLPAGDPQKPVVTAYRKDYEAKVPKSEVSTFGGHAYDGLMIGLNAVKAAGGAKDKAKVRDAMKPPRVMARRRRGQHVGHRSHGAGPERLPHARGQGRQLVAGAVRPGGALRGRCRRWTGPGWQYVAERADGRRDLRAGRAGLYHHLQRLHAINFAQGEFVMIGGMARSSWSAAGLPWRGRAHGDWWPRGGRPARPELAIEPAQARAPTWSR